MSRPGGSESTRDFKSNQGPRFAAVWWSERRRPGGIRIGSPNPTMDGPDNSPIAPT